MYKCHVCRCDLEDAGENAIIVNGENILLCDTCVGQLHELIMERRAKQQD